MSPAAKMMARLASQRAATQVLFMDQTQLFPGSPVTFNMASETGPLLGSSISTPVTALSSLTRVHFLDNLRTTLTIILIFHHAVLETTTERWIDSKATLLPLSLFTKVNTVALWVSFFFVSGYSTSLSLDSKSDLDHFKSRTLKTGLPALIYGTIGQVFLFLFLAFGWEAIFGSYKAAWAFMRLSGPIPYVVLLMLFEYAYLFIRWSARRLSYTTPIEPIGRRNFIIILITSSILLIAFTYLECIKQGIPIQIIWYFMMIGYEVPTPDAPVAYIIAYTAGIYFISVRKYAMLSSSKQAWTAFSVALFTAYLTMGIAQDLFPPLWESVRIRMPFESHEIFWMGGFNWHTAFFILWDAVIVYTIPIFLVAGFAHTSWTKKEWGIWARKTYFQTYIHMIPILMAIYHLQDVQNRILKSMLVGLLGVLGSWAMALPIIILSSRLNFTYVLVPDQFRLCG